MTSELYFTRPNRPLDSRLTLGASGMSITKSKPHYCPMCSTDWDCEMSDGWHNSWSDDFRCTARVCLPCSNKCERRLEGLVDCILRSMGKR